MKWMFAMSKWYVHNSRHVFQSLSSISVGFPCVCWMEIIDVEWLKVRVFSSCSSVFVRRSVRNFLIRLRMFVFTCSSACRCDIMSGCAKFLSILDSLIGISKGITI